MIGKNTRNGKNKHRISANRIYTWRRFINVYLHENTSGSDKLYQKPLKSKPQHGEKHYEIGKMLPKKYGIKEKGEKNEK